MKNAFRIYCHLKDGVEFEGGLLQCSDISIQGTPSALKAIGEFLASCAERFESLNGSEIAHFHLSDEWRSWDTDFTDIVSASLPVSDK
ncbi:Imm32 family immunity protein [Ralstonia pseudosolanacearum]|uniref:Uncharacterized protein n=1 Tax=Ralstonia solanacearum TaxID=305 RepID=A0AA92JUE4_RALSL|nr:hypothetical protein [Ralstonia pseudosolanacearum]QOK92870.1 hypothetical protein HF908_16195 [Ralstonia pseudosolanacearum]QOK97767.1 hypothetical protein HF909_15925 [Ralstonia pseudosolanacearum]UWD90563.1 hypothetical protein NY025_23515 [Ralstonia pseudosolanacearum]CAH0445633.1 hypothetical protein LMG9673_04666 [Ralstonia pseudosolanacearum]